MGIVEVPLYDKALTYIIAMKTKDGLLLASDGLVENVDPHGNSTSIDYHTPKIYDLTDHVVVGFAGAVSLDMDNYIDGLKVPIEKFNPKTALEIVEFAGIQSLRNFKGIIERHNSGLDILFCGFDLSTKDNLYNPRIYLVSNERGENVIDIDSGFYDIGYIDGGRQVLESEYSRTYKGYNKLKNLAIKAINASASKNPHSVGGDIFIKHVTKKGILTEIIPYNE